MGKHSNLGPVDPQFNGIPAYGVVSEIQRAYDEIVNEPRRASVWTPILSRYPPSFVQQCHWAIERTEEFVTRSLQENMLSALPPKAREAKAKKIFEKLSDLSKNKGHDKHIHAEECIDIGLEVKTLESDKVLQDLVLTVHHCYMHTMTNTGAFKVVENHVGRAWVKIQQQQVMLLGGPGPFPGMLSPSLTPSGPTH